ncbi:MAG: response regulator [Alphaproteobacteria bacterium]|nr:response regulator [Alphaproteobacteria bacterium]
MVKIVIVEDNEMNMRLFSDLLQVRGYRVAECLDATKAVALVRKEKPDLILMDIQLPEISGLTLIERIRRLPAFRKTPIVAISAFVMPAEERAILNSGCDAYLSKPIDIPTFFKTIAGFAPPPARAAAKG